MVMGPRTLLLGMVVLVALVLECASNTNTQSTSIAKSTILAMIITKNAFTHEKSHKTTTSAATILLQVAPESYL